MSFRNVFYLVCDGCSIIFTDMTGVRVYNNTIKVLYEEAKKQKWKEDKNNHIFCKDCVKKNEKA